MLAELGVLFDQGVLHFQPEKTLNSLFPDIKGMTARDALEIACKKQSSRVLSECLIKLLNISSLIDSSHTYESVMPSGSNT